MRWTTIAVTLAMACAPPDNEPPEPPAPEATADTGAPAPQPDLTSVTLSLSGDVAGTTLALMDAGVVLSQRGDHWRSVVPEGDTVTLELGPAPRRHRVNVGENATGVRWAWYIAALFNDTNLNGIPDEGELYVGAAPWWLIYLDGTSEALESDGFSEGWNVLRSTLTDEGTLGFLPMDAAPLEVHAPANEATLSGRYDLNDGARWALLPEPEQETPGTVDALYFDDVIASEWTLTVQGPPPADHFADGRPVGHPSEISLLSPRVYTDDDESGSWTPGDTLLDTTVCASDRFNGAVKLAWLTRTDDLLSTFRYGGRTGWVVIREQVGATFAPIGTPTDDLVVGECTPVLPEPE